MSPAKQIPGTPDWTQHRLAPKRGSTRRMSGSAFHIHCLHQSQLQRHWDAANLDPSWASLTCSQPSFISKESLRMDQIPHNRTSPARSVVGDDEGSPHEDSLPACLSCRRRKSRCSRERPRCAQCFKIGITRHAFHCRL